jgi:hypothetical protein
MSSSILQELEPTENFFKWCFNRQEKQRSCNMRFEWMKKFLSNIVQRNHVGKVPVHS